MPLDFFLHNLLIINILGKNNFPHFFWTQIILFLLLGVLLAENLHFQHNIDNQTFTLKTKCFFNLILKQIKKSVKGVIL